MNTTQEKALIAANNKGSTTKNNRLQVYNKIGNFSPLLGECLLIKAVLNKG